MFLLMPRQRGRRNLGTVQLRHSSGRWPRAMATFPEVYIASSMRFIPLFDKRTTCHDLLLFLLCSFRQHLSNGQIANVGGKKCLGAEGDTVALTDCDSASTWETQGNGESSCLLLSLL